MHKIWRILTQLLIVFFHFRKKIVFLKKKTVFICNAFFFQAERTIGSFGIGASQRSLALLQSDRTNLKATAISPARVSEKGDPN
jgi:hypothetical protein